MNKRLIFAAAIALALAVQVALLAVFWPGDDDDPEEVAEPAPARAIYYSLRPPFVVTLPYGDRQFMLQADLAVMAHRRSAIEAVMRHGPLIRAEVIDYLTDLDPHDLQAQEGKAQILDGLTALINAALEREAEAETIDSVLFNNLVMQ